MNNIILEKWQATLKNLNLDPITGCFHNREFHDLVFEIGPEEYTIYYRIPFSYRTLWTSRKYLNASFERAFTIYTDLLIKPDIMRMTITNETRDEVMKALKKCGIGVADYEIAEYNSFWEENVINMFWQVSEWTKQIELIIKQIIYADIGGLNSFASSVLFINSEIDLLYYLYDDRGLIVSAANRDDLINLYKDHNKWILEYNRDEIDRHFADVIE